MNQQSDNLELEILRLRDENEQLKSQLQRNLDFDRLNWHLSGSINTKLQLSSTSIKAAVSSLLDRNIFWEVSAQQEFLETIRQSIDNISERVVNLALANLLQAGSLEVSRKFYELHELMRAVQERYLQTTGNMLHYYDLVENGSLTFVDYRYFVHALSLLFSVVGTGDSIKLSHESGYAWYVLYLSNLTEPIHTVMQSILQEQWVAESLYRDLPAEKIYELLLVVRLLEYQGIRLLLDDSQTKGIRIEIPINEPD